MDRRLILSLAAHLIGCVAILFLLPAQSFANPPVAQATAGPVVTFAEADIAFADQDTPPVSGWQRRRLPQLWLSDDAQKVQSGELVVWARIRFDPAELGEGKLAILTENNREQVTILVNGVETFRNFANDREPAIGWNSPYLAPLPRSLLREGGNEIHIRAASQAGFSLSIGTVAAGPQNLLAAQYKRQNFFRIDAPRIANWTMLLLAMLILAMWLGRLQEIELLWLGLTGVVWFVRNYHFFAKTAPFDPFLFQQLTYYSIYFAIALTLAFCAEFLKLPRRRAIIAAMLALGLALSLARFALALGDRTDLISSLMSVILHGGFLVILFRYWLLTRTTDSLLVLLVLTFTALSGIHDIGRIPNVNWWDGAGFHFQPYVGFGIFIIFLLSLGQRFLSALSLVEQTNAHLESRVAQATSDLAASEAVRHRLEMERAIELERERLMQEMHDRVGSNLVTALSVAQNRGESPATIRTLKRAIDDLKITVDSLAPYDGDVVTLLGNLRHRMEADLTEAGVASIWRVEECPRLLWLDPPKALHLLRLLQEAISNVLAHAEATSILLECRPEEHLDRSGIHVGIADNGKGLPPNAVAKGRGVNNMRQRAKMLSAEFDIMDRQESGTLVKLWLPLEQLK